LRRLRNGNEDKLQYALMTVDDLRQLNQFFFYAYAQDSAKGPGVCDEIAIGCERQRLKWFAGRGRQFVVTESACNSANLSQRSIYDKRYSKGLYEDRSVPVLTAERDALSNAMQRTVASHPFGPRISLFDFGYGTGRFINEWIKGDARQYMTLHPELRVVAYDVSSVGLRKAQETLGAAGYEPTGPVSWKSEAAKGYVAGAIRKREPGFSVTVVFVHGCEGEPPDVMRELVLSANDGDRYLLTTCLYGGLGHVPGDELRREYFRQLSELTSPFGEIILCLSSTGDLVELQPEWAARMATGDTGGFPIEQPGDLVYYTELGQPNFYHVFSVELNDYMKSITAAGQRWWIEGIRYPGDEFESAEAEQENYRLVRQANARKRDRIWNAEDYREFHSIAAFRSPASSANGD
jgi:hypothetical protein